MMHIAYSSFISAKFINSPYFRKIYKFPLYFVQFTFCLLNLHFFASPYFDHDTFTHHALHLLDAPASLIPKQKPKLSITSVNKQKKCTTLLTILCCCLDHLRPPAATAS